MRRFALLLALAGAASLVTAFDKAAAGPSGTVTCDQITQAFTGTATDLIVPVNGYCAIDHATIKHDIVVQAYAAADISNSTIQNDVIYQQNTGGSITRSTVGVDVTVGFAGQLDLTGTKIGRDFVATNPGEIGTDAVDYQGEFVGRNTVGRDFVINGGPGTPPDPTNTIDPQESFDGFCGLSVGRDFRFVNRWLNLGATIGCASYPDTVGHDLVVNNDQVLTSLYYFPPSDLGVGGTTVGHDLVYTNNTGIPGAAMFVGGNHVGHDAICTNNSPAPGALYPNVVGHVSSCP